MDEADLGRAGRGKYEILIGLSKSVTFRFFISGLKPDPKEAVFFFSLFHNY